MAFTDEIQISPHQQMLLEAPDDENLALLGGRNSGKSAGLVMLNAKHSEAYGDKARNLIVRHTFKSVSELFDESQAFCAKAYGKVKANRGEHTLTLPNGSKWEFGALDDASDYLRYQGRSFTQLTVDEAGNVRDFTQVDKLKSNLRGVPEIPLRTIIAGNPGGAAHSLIYQRHIVKAPWRKRYIGDDGEAWRNFGSTYRDNPFVDHQVAISKIRAACGGNEHLFRAWLDNDWSTAYGAMLADVCSPDHQMFDAWPHPIKAPFRSFISMDFGTARPSVIYACVVIPAGGCKVGKLFMPAGSVALIREISTNVKGNWAQGTHLPAGVLAERILEMCGELNIPPTGVGDDSTSYDCTTLLQFFQTFGIFMVKPVKGRIAGLTRMRDMLFNAKQRNGKPGMFISSLCPAWWAVVPVLPRDENNPSDVDTQAAGDDHYDSSRYALQYAAQGHVTQSTTVGGY